MKNQDFLFWVPLGMTRSPGPFTRPLMIVMLALGIAQGKAMVQCFAQEQETAPAKSDAAWVVKAKRILEIGSEERTTEDEKKKAYSELKSLKPSVEDDARLVYSFILAAMAEKKWPAVQDLSANMLKHHKNYLPARVAFIRTLLHDEKKRLQAITELESLAKGLQTPDKKVSQNQLEAAAGFLGLAVGFVEGPCKDSLKATSIKDLIASTDNIPESLNEAFSKSRSIINEEYRVLIESGEEALKELRDSEAKEMEQMKAELEEKRKLAEQKTEANKKRLEASWAQAKGSWDAAWSQCQTLSKNAAVLQMQQQQLQSQLALLVPPQPDNKGNINPAAQRQYLQLKTQLDNSIANLSFQYNQISVEYDNAIRKGIVLENQMNAIRIEAQQLGLSFEMENESFGKLEKMVKGKEKKIAKKPESKLSAAKLRQARAFTTYDDFNYFKEQSMLLEAFPE